MFYYLSAKFFSILSYTFALFFIEKNLINISKNDIMNVFLYVDILCPIIFLIIFRNKINYKNIFKSKLQLLVFIVPCFTSFLKSYLLAFIQISNIAISNLLTPIVVSVMAIFIFNDKIKLKQVPFLLTALCGFIIANYKIISLNHFNYIVFYIVCNAFSDVILRYYCIKKKNDYDAIFIQNLIYMIYGLIAFLFGYIFHNDAVKYFNINIVLDYHLLINPYILLIALCCFSHHFCIIKAVRKANSLITLEFLNFSSIVFAIILSYMFFNQFPSLEKIIGAVVILFSIIFCKILK